MFFDGIENWSTSSARCALGAAGRSAATRRPTEVAPRRLTPLRLEAVTDPRWWTVRRAHSLKPATYRCPLCDRPLHAMSEHVLMTPEGDSSRRRHAHTECVRRAREAGDLPTYD